MPLWRLHYHLVWATRGREHLVDDHVEQITRESILATGKRLELIIHATGTMPDHVHIAASIPPKHSISEVVRAFKGASTRHINQSARAGAPEFRWQSEYGALSFSDHGLGEVISYVEHQQERHAANDLYALMEQCGESAIGRSGPPGAKGPGLESEAR
jgi:putative transposase